MAVLVTGGSGFIGSHIVDKLIDSGKNVKVFDIIRPHRNDVEFIKGDITSQDQLNAAMQDIEYLYHVAALSDINKVEQRPIDAVNLNILSTAKVLDAARVNNVSRVLFASSYFVNSGRGHLYTTTKKSSEMILKDYDTLYGLKYTILRYGTAYGPRSRGDDVISIFVKKALSNEPIEIHGSGDQSRNFIYVEDLAQGNVAALNSKAQNKTYTLEGNHEISIKKVAETINHLFDGKLKIQYGPGRIDDNIGKKISTTVSKDLKWEPKVNFEEGCKKYIDWYKNSCINKIL